MKRRISIAQAISEAAKILNDSNLIKPREDANLLLRHVLGRDKTFLIAHDDYILTETENETFFQLIKRRSQNEPIQHLTGKQEFFGLEFEVSPDVLIPRPETEILVEIALEILRKKENARFCEVGIGSGCVAVSLLKNLENVSAIGLDISPSALKVAARNAEKQKVSEKLQLFESDVFSSFHRSPFTIHHSPFDLIVSNPPYIPETAAPNLASEVRDFEPSNALFSGADGFDVIRILLRDAPLFLMKNGFLAFEIGFGQAEKLKELIDNKVWNLIEIRRDWQNIPRTVLLQIH